MASSPDPGPHAPRPEGDADDQRSRPSDERLLLLARQIERGDYRVPVADVADAILARHRAGGD